MILWPRLRWMAALLLFGGITLASAGPVAAQVGPNPIGPTTPTEDKPKGVAEEAPSDTGQLPTTPVLPPPQNKRKQFQLFELDGYFRFRTDWFKKFNMGFRDDGPGGAPFPDPLGCGAEAAEGTPCDSSLRSANIRLRLEPVINLDESTSVHFQVDVLDNLVLGSSADGVFLDGTPRPGNIPTGVFSDSQVAPEAGRNALTDSIVVKRAWAEVMTPLGLLKFGRMPNQWGLGILANAGGHDPLHGTYDFDGDFGDSVDRLIFSTNIPSTPLSAAIGVDWGQSAPTAAQTELWQDRYFGQPYDLDDNDDVNDWVFIVADTDSPERFQEKLDEGELALNYGAYVTYRTQDWEYDFSSLEVGEEVDAEMFVPRSSKLYIPDLWLRVGYQQFTFEAEAVARFGDLNGTSNLETGTPEELDVKQLGAVARLELKLLDDTLRLGLEAGYASGDEWDNNPQGSLHFRNAQLIPGAGDDQVNRFLFDPEYEIDLILFRELMGAVSNATYARPSVTYDITKSISFRGQGVVSFANEEVATPGNARMYGVELDGDLGYHNGAFFAGISYGVLFPLAALDHPRDEDGGGGPGFNYEDNAGNAEIAQTFQTRLIVAF